MNTFASAGRSSPNSSLPLYKLSIELVSMILTSCCDTGIPLTLYNWKRLLRSLLAITSVSIGLRNAAIETPALWLQVFIMPGRIDKASCLNSLNIAKLFFQRAKKRKTTIFICFPPPFPMDQIPVSTFQEVIGLALETCEDFTLLISRQECMNVIFPLPGKLRNLKKLKVFGVDYCWDGHLFKEDDPEVRLDTLEIQTPISRLSALSEFNKSMASSIRTCTLDGMVDSLDECTEFFNNAVNIKHLELGYGFLVTSHRLSVALAASSPVTLPALTSVKLGSSSHKYFFERLSFPSLRHLSLRADCHLSLDQISHPPQWSPNGDEPPLCTLSVSASTLLSAIPAIAMLIVCMDVVMLECQTTHETLNKLLDFIGSFSVPRDSEGGWGAFERLSYFRINYDGPPLSDAQTVVAANWIEHILTHKPNLRVDYYDTSTDEPFSEMPFAGLETSFPSRFRPDYAMGGFGVDSLEKLYEGSLTAEKAGVGEQR
ncbi:uncharacterized protein EI90DRAFT_3044404 [Cantharellus anzutake]|uniref:uncharacterized protein n=1 Tax=Cantharellus anzutake TaxID=1750568 RepID=UPI0019075B65|nr:uncharacterized protein EI90DRAFT_3044404 [Cantharellus anzutake]KAF8336979.1 hypothetical protein EI90DRAFT_3044404 [Cantharellus anzutake]